MRSDKSVASVSPDKCSDSGDPIDQRLAEIDALVETENFARIEVLVQSLPGLVARVPGADRKSSLLKIQSFLNDVQIRAESKSETIGSRLQSVRSGRAATSAYAAAKKLGADG